MKMYQIDDPVALVNKFVGNGVRLAEPTIGDAAKEKKRAYDREYMRRVRKENPEKYRQLTRDAVGAHRARKRAANRGQSKDHAAYMRVWRSGKAA